LNCLTSSITMFISLVIYSTVYLSASFSS
jgi:hypothetical protein